MLPHSRDALTCQSCTYQSLLTYLLTLPAVHYSSRWEK